MKPNYALGLTDDGVTLWQRGKDGWLRVGAVALDVDDMDRAMAALVARAAEVGPKDLTAKLVIPSEHLLLTHVAAPGPGPEAQANQIRAALQGRTPFPVEELVFDWSGAGTTVAVAVVARETLLEAEEFALAQGLIPQCFVAARAPDGFRGEPFLGLTRSARAQGLDVANLRDPEVVRQTGIAVPPPPAQPITPVTITPAAKSAPAAPEPAPVAPAPESAPETAADAAETVGDDSASKPDAASDTPAPDPAKTKPAAPAIASPKPDAIPSPAAKTSDVAFRSRRALTAPLAQPMTTAAARSDGGVKPSSRSRKSAPKMDLGAVVQSKLAALRTSLSALRMPALPKIALPAQLGKSGADGATPSATSPANDPLAQLRRLQTGTKAAQPSTAPAAKPSAPALSNPSEAERLTVFGARGAGTASAPTPLPQRALLIVGGGVLLLVCAAIWALYFARGTDTAAPAPVPDDIAPPAAIAELAPEDRVLPPVEDLAAIEAALGPEDAAQSDRPAEDGSDQGLPAGAEAALQPVPQPVPEIQTQLDSPADQAVAPNLTEALSGRLAEIRSNGIIAPQDHSGLPQAPLAPAPFGADPLPPLRNAAAAPADAPVSAPAPEVASEAVAAAPDPEAGLQITVQQGRPPSRPPAKPARFLQPEAPPAEPAAPQQQGAIAPQGDAQNQSTASTLADPPDGTVASVAPATDAPALPDTAQTQPAPPVTEAALRIAVTQGPPPVLPPRRADSAATLRAPAPADAPPAAIAPAALPADEQGLAITVTPGTPPVLPPRRDTTPAQDAPDQAALAPAPDAASAEAAPPDALAARASVTPGAVALTALRPLPRPSDLRTAPLPEPAPEFANASALAVANSLRPRARPSGFAEIVQRSLRAATRQQAATNAPPEAVQTASAAVAAQPMPNLPTSTSVAREATQTRAINLRQVNLIGVMGTPANRRALVRLSNGRVVTVRVGERLDDGQVTAISDSELRYNKRGRDVVLRIAS